MCSECTAVNVPTVRMYREEYANVTSQTNFNVTVIHPQDLLFPLQPLQYHSYLWLTGLVILLEGSDI